MLVLSSSLNALEDSNRFGKYNQSLFLNDNLEIELEWYKGDILLNETTIDPHYHTITFESPFSVLIIRHLNETDCGNNTYSRRYRNGTSLISYNIFMAGRKLNNYFILIKF